MDANPNVQPKRITTIQANPQPKTQVQYFKCTQIGKGAQSDVYQGYIDDGVNTEVAIKIYNSKVQEVELKAQQIFIGKKFFHLVNIIDQVTENDGTVKTVMEKGSLNFEQYMKLEEFKKKNHEEKNKLFLQIVKGVEELHNQGFFHRDLKPSNIICFKSKEKEGKIILKICDLGCVWEINKKPLLNVSGTEKYSPLEQKTLNHDQSVDIWALGIIWCEILDIQGLDVRKIKYVQKQEEINRIIQQCIMLTNKEIQILQQMLQLDFQQRITVLQLIKELQNLNHKSNINNFKSFQPPQFNRSFQQFQPKPISEIDFRFLNPGAQNSNTQHLQKSQTTQKINFSQTVNIKRVLNKCQMPNSFQPQSVCGIFAKDDFLYKLRDQQFIDPQFWEAMISNMDNQNITDKTKLLQDFYNAVHVNVTKQLEYLIHHQPFFSQPPEIKKNEIITKIFEINQMRDLLKSCENQLKKYELENQPNTNPVCFLYHQPQNIIFDISNPRNIVEFNRMIIFQFKYQIGIINMKNISKHKKEEWIKKIQKQLSQENQTIENKIKFWKSHLNLQNEILDFNEEKKRYFYSKEAFETCQKLVNNNYNNLHTETLQEQKIKLRDLFQKYSKLKFFDYGEFVQKLETISLKQQIIDFLLKIFNCSFFYKLLKLKQFINSEDACINLAQKYENILNNMPNNKSETQKQIKIDEQNFDQVLESNLKSLINLPETKTILLSQI